MEKVVRGHSGGVIPGSQILKRLQGEVAELADVERAPKLEGYNMTMILTPKKTN
jgi:translation initiation factor IF-3